MMNDDKKWADKRYNSFNYFLRNKFGGKVFKISLDGGFTCPNRDGKVARGGCTFCSSRGSGDFAGERVAPISEQFEEIKIIMKKKWKTTDKYIAYFQAYTNTYAPIDELRAKYEEAISKEGVVGLAIGTRPDCISEEVLDLLEEMNKKVYVWLEIGLQTIHEQTANDFNRGYSLEVFDKAVEGLRSRGIDTVVHSIFGLPGETKEMMLETVDYIASKNVTGIKFHLLHLMKKTRMVKDYEAGKIEFMSQEEYVDLICEGISRIPEEYVVHRLTGDAPRDMLIGPMWSLKKWEVLNDIDKALEDRGIYQGKNYKK